VKGRLADFNPGELIQMFGLLGKSGSLSLNRDNLQGLIVFRGGRIIYAASSAVRENLGSLLLARNLISEDELLEALERKSRESDPIRLGNILVEMGALPQRTLEEVIQEQFSRIISGFFHWSSGEFSFECREFADHGEVEVAAEEFLVGPGVESTHVLLEAARQADELAIEDEAESPSLDSLIDGLGSPAIGGEVVYKLLDLVGDLCGRCVLFAVHTEAFRAVGHYGVETDGAAGRRLSQLQVGRESASLLARAVDKRVPLLAKLDPVEGDASILEALGGPSESKSLALPVELNGQVILVVYGDQLVAGLSTGWIEQLEIAIAEAVRENRMQPTWATESSQV
jgi:hypothetical protein